MELPGQPFVVPRYSDDDADAFAVVGIRHGSRDLSVTAPRDREQNNSEHSGAGPTIRSESSDDVCRRILREASDAVAPRRSIAWSRRRRMGSKGACQGRASHLPSAPRRTAIHRQEMRHARQCSDNVFLERSSLCARLSAWGLSVAPLLVVRRRIQGWRRRHAASTPLPRMHQADSPRFSFSFVTSARGPAGTFPAVEARIRGDLR